MTDKPNHLRVLGEDDDTPVHHRHRSIYLLPNAFTTAALFCAFFAMVKATAGEFDIAAISIFFSMVLRAVDQHAKRVW